MIKKKFRKRVCLYTEYYYIVQYAHYRWFPVWKTLNFWFEQFLTSGTECWSTKLFRVEEAMKLATSLKSIEDVMEYYRPDKEAEALFNGRKLNFLEERVPFVRKEIV